ncbi:hypothetical protein PV325_013833 [Microctonus aethiopoides]|nr:hypothetical protein PV325_013833 [Microctonus aethiopoides]KAK0091218.1 hypothetical protein PV326_003564 [Microctonus aethiopoides]
MNTYRGCPLCLNNYDLELYFREISDVDENELGFEVTGSVPVRIREWLSELKDHAVLGRKSGNPKTGNPQKSTNKSLEHYLQTLQPKKIPLADHLKRGGYSLMCQLYIQLCI